VKGGVDWSARNENFCTFLHVASKRGYADIVKVLIDEGVDMTLKNREGKTALEVARDNRRGATVAVLAKAQEFMSQLTQTALDGGNMPLGLQTMCLNTWIWKNQSRDPNHNRVSQKWHMCHSDNCKQLKEMPQTQQEKKGRVTEAKRIQRKREEEWHRWHSDSCKQLKEMSQIQEEKKGRKR